MGSSVSKKVNMLDLFPADLTNEILLSLNTQRDIFTYILLTEKLKNRYLNDDDIWRYLFSKKIGGHINPHYNSFCDAYIRKVNMVGEKQKFSSYYDEPYVEELVNDHNNILLKFILRHGFNDYHTMIIDIVDSKNEELLDYLLETVTWEYNPLTRLSPYGFPRDEVSYRMFQKSIEKTGIHLMYLITASADGRKDLIELSLPYLSEETKKSLKEEAKSFGLTL